MELRLVPVLVFLARYVEEREMPLMKPFPVDKERLYEAERRLQLLP